MKRPMLVAAVIFVSGCAFGCASSPSTERRVEGPYVLHVEVFKTWRGQAGEEPTFVFSLPVEPGELFEHRYEKDDEWVEVSGEIAPVAGDPNAFHLVIGYRDSANGRNTVVPPDPGNPVTTELGQTYIHHTFPSFDGRQYRYRLVSVEPRAVMMFGDDPDRWLDDDNEPD